MLKKYMNTPHLFPVLSGPLRFRWLYWAPRHGFKKILGVYEKVMANRMTHLIKPGHICIDIGAHIGYFSLLMGIKTREHGLVIAIDPIKCNVLGIKKAFLKNKLKKPIVFAYGASDRSGIVEAEVYTDSDMVHFKDAALITDAPSHTTKLLQLTTIDTLVSQMNLRSVNFIKIDVEGYEEKVILGSKNSIRKWHPTLIVEIHTHELGVKVFYLLKKFGYTVYNIDEIEIKESAKLINYNLQYFLLAKYHET